MIRHYRLSDTEATIIANRMKECPCDLKGKDGCMHKPYCESPVGCCDGALRWLEEHRPLVVMER